MDVGGQLWTIRARDSHAARLRSCIWTVIVLLRIRRLGVRISRVRSVSPCQGVARRPIRSGLGFPLTDLSRIALGNRSAGRCEHLAESCCGRLRAERGPRYVGLQMHGDTVPQKGSRVGRCLTRPVQHQSDRMPHVVQADHGHIGRAAQPRESVAVRLGPDRLAERVHQDEVVVDGVRRPCPRAGRLPAAPTENEAAPQCRSAWPRPARSASSLRSSGRPWLSGARRARPGQPRHGPAQRKGRPTPNAVRVPRSV